MIAGTKPWNMGEVRRAIEMRSRGLSIAAVARALGRDRVATARHLRRFAGEKPRPRGGHLPGLRARLRGLAARGLHVAAIARELGRSHHTVRRWLRLLGLTVPSGRTGTRHAGEVYERIAAANHQRRADECAALGWPEVGRPVHARVLSHLGAAGSASVVQLASALGWALYRNNRGRLCSPNLSAVLKQMQHLRLIEKRFLPGRRVVYAVAPWLLARRGEAS